MTFKKLCELIAFALVLGTHYTLEHAAVLRLLATAHFDGIVATPVSERVMGPRSARARATDAQKQLLRSIQSRINYLWSTVVMKTTMGQCCENWFMARRGQRMSM